MASPFNPNHPYPGTTVILKLINFSM